jgi:hypothetical protein
MKIIYSKDEVIEIMKTAVSELIDVEITDIDFAHFSDEFLHILCIKKEKTLNPRRWVKEPSYQTPVVPGE